jgi:hypothetical protein
MASASFALPVHSMPGVVLPRGNVAPPLSIERIGGHALLIIALLLVNKGGIAGTSAFFAVLAVAVLQSPEWAYKAMTLAFFGLCCNQWYVPKTPLWTVARFILPMLILLRFSLDLSRMNASLFRYRFFIMHLGFIAIAAMLTSLTGYFVHISLLKLFNYTVVTTAIFAGIEVMRQRRSDLCEWYMTLIVVAVVLGLASFPLGIAYNAKALVREGAISYFNGPFYHSNTLGPFAAMMSLYVMCVYLFGPYRNRWICGPLLLVLIYFMRASQSRTSFAALAVSMMVLIGLVFVLTRRRHLALRLNTHRSSLVAAAFAGFIAVMAVDLGTGGKLTNSVTKFVNKGGKSESVDLDQVLYSRMGRIHMSLENFRSSPLIGIGFEVGTDEYFKANATLFNAPVEKGFLPTAILEQSGVIGTAMFVAWLLTLTSFLMSRVNVPGLVLLCGFLTVNCGEVMFFGVAGHGGFGWLLMAGGIMLGDYTIRDLRWLRRRQPADNQDGLTWSAVARRSHSLVGS